MRARASGFTLIEVVAAFAILALVLGVVFQIFSTGLARTGELEDYSRALVVAQSKLASAGAEEALREGDSQGDTEDRRYHWTVGVKKYEEMSEPGKPVPANIYSLYRIDVQVQWKTTEGRTKQVALSSLQMGVIR